MTINNLNNSAGSVNPEFLDEMADEIKCISFMIASIGESVTMSGIPSDLGIFDSTMSRLSSRLDSLAETLDTIRDEMIAADDPEGEGNE